jgi:glycosyltransferase involved in cell wall biosynthesis
MKIAFILPRLVNQGPIVVAKDIIDSIKDKVDLIDVYYFDDIRELSIDCNLYKISFFDKIDFDKYDVVHSHMLRPDFYIWFHRKKRHNKALFVSTLHQNIYDNLKGNYGSLIAFVFEKLWLRFLKKCDVVVTLTDVMNSYYSNKTKLNLKTIYNGRNVKTENKDITSDADSKLLYETKSKFKIIGSHCLLTKRKGIDQIIRSLVFLKEFALVIVGDGQELLNLKALADECHVSERCFFLGYKHNAVSYLRYFDIYVMSSYSEGFPLGLLEAGLNKLPVVCSDIPIFRELFSEKEVSFFELDNIDSLSKSIQICYENRFLFSQYLYDTINEKYSNDKMAENYMLLYQNCF